MQANPRYDDVVAEVTAFLAASAPTPPSPLAWRAIRSGSIPATASVSIAGAANLALVRGLGADRRARLPGPLRASRAKARSRRSLAMSWPPSASRRLNRSRAGRPRRRGRRRQGPLDDAVNPAGPGGGPRDRSASRRHEPARSQGPGALAIAGLRPGRRRRRPGRYQDRHRAGWLCGEPAGNRGDRARHARRLRHPPDPAADHRRADPRRTRRHRCRRRPRRPACWARPTRSKWCWKPWPSSRISRSSSIR